MGVNNFLESIAEQCKNQFGDKCDELQIIFPNKRAGVYFANYLASMYDKPIWSPKINSFEEFVEVKQESKLADELQLSFILYQAYRTIVPSAESFDAFLHWGEMILKDFNDIDNYLVDTSHIFRVVKSQKELEESFQFLEEEDQQVIRGFWRGFLPVPDAKQIEFIKTWSILDELYRKFTQLLDKKQLTYKGRLFRQCLNGLDNYEDQQSIWFVGFNALTKAEEGIIKYYLKRGNSDIFWDVDEHYLNDSDQESGIFFRSYIQDDFFKESIERDTKNRINQKGKRVEITSAAFSLGQIYAARQHLDKVIKSGDKLNDTLIVLTDESMLPNVLRNLPDSLDTVNVTMGWSIVQSRVYMMLQQLIFLQERVGSEGFRRIYFRDLKGVLGYGDLLDFDEESIRLFEGLITSSNQLYFSKEHICELFPSLEKILFTGIDTNEHIQSLVSFLETLDNQSLDETESSVVVTLHALLKRVKLASIEFGISLQMKSFLKFFKKMGVSQKLPYSGDINDGLQIMGLLETRNLSFENVMIIGMNEGAWPKDSSNSSFIPYNIRKAFDLPVIEHQDAMQSYLFYRLLHSANNLWVSYNNITEFNNNGELSRYVQQLQFETDIDFVHQSFVSPLESQPTDTIVIEKRGGVLEKLNEFLSVGPERSKLSPSAISTYVDCSLKFYFNYIEKIYEPEEVKEDIAPNLLGNLLHAAMEHLYTGHYELSPIILESLKDKIDEALNRAFVDEHLSLADAEKEFMVGRQAIVHEVIKSFMQAIVAFDTKNAPFDLIALESKDFFVDYPINIKGKVMKVSLKGIIDRVDQYQGRVRIIDYKSGADDREFGEMNDLIDSKKDKRPKGVFQLLYYSMLYKENHPKNELPIQPGMFNSRDLFKKDFDLLIKQKKVGAVMDYLDYEQEFKVLMSILLEELFDPEIPFVQTEDEKKCEYCPYINICQKG